MCWSLLSIPEVALTQLKFLLGKPTHECVGSIEDAMNSEFVSNKLSGKVSQITSDIIFKRKSNADVLTNFEQMLRFFQVQDG